MNRYGAFRAPYAVSTHFWGWLELEKQLVPWWMGYPHADSLPIKPAVSPVPRCWGGYCGGLINKAVALRPLCPSKARVPPHLAHYTHFSRCFRCTVPTFK